MATRFGDANQDWNQEPNEANNNNNDQVFQRRSTKHYEQAVNPHHTVQFKEFTRESLANIKRRQLSRDPNNKKKQSTTPSNNGNDTTTDPIKPEEPDPYLASGQQLSPALARQMPSELIGRPIEDIDPFYEDQETFVIISRGKEITRFSAKEALYLFGPFHPIRRIVLFILVSPIFNLLVISTILINCILMTIQGSETVEKTEIIFTIVYTTEMGLKVLARGFIVDNFTYLRDPWNWLDFAVILMAYLTIVMKDLGNLSVMRTFRVLRALKTVAIIPGMKTIVGAVIDSVKNLKDVVVLTLFSLSVFSLLGLQIYMGILTQKCILNGPGNMNDTEWFAWSNNSEHWIPEPDDEIFGAYRLCGNATGAQSCPDDYTCLQGFGKNPDYGYTNFDTFGWALICSFRLMTQDFWEGLYMQVLKTAGSWHIIFFLVSIFLGSIYLMNLILAIVAMSYNELQRRAEEEEEAAAQDEAAFLESCRLMEIQDQMSQFSRSTPDPGTSYRPSVEIGLVGQTLLASLCQNGLLGQNVRDKLNQQMMLPVAGGATNQAVRSHSLSVHLETRRNSHYNNGNGSGNGNDNSSQHRSYNLHTSKYDPLTMAASMTELRRKSSVRTNDSGSPTAGNRSGGGGVYLGQRRLLPSIGLSGARLDRSAAEQRRMSQRLHSSGGLLLTKRKDSDNVSETGSATMPANSFFRRFPSSRPSATSDRDLKSLKQRAAMIRIGSPNTFSLDDNRADSLYDQQQQQQHQQQQQQHQRQQLQQPQHQISGDSVDLLHVGRQSRINSIRSHPIVADSSLLGEMRLQTNLDLLHYGSADLQHLSPSASPTRLVQQDISYSRSTETTPTKKRTFGSEAAICQQPTSLHPFGQFATMEEQQQQQQQHRQQQLQRAYQRASMTSRLSINGGGQRRRSSATMRHNNRRSSTMSNFEGAPKTQQQVELGQQLTLGDRRQGAQQQKQQRQSQQQHLDAAGSVRTLQSNQNSWSTATNTTIGSGRPSNRNLFVDNQQMMHHLSVENFQHFGALRTAATTTASTSNQLQVAGEQQLLDPMNGAAFSHRHGSFQGQIGDNNYLYESSSGGNNNGNRYRQQNIHPSTMVRSSFSRPRQSIIAGGQGGGGDNTSQAGGPGGSTAVRRMSKDFVRRASDWSRLSMSANVDLRRLLKLWSYTNPYQGGNAAGGGRPSIGSFSNCSQAGRSEFDSPAHSIYNTGNGNSNRCGAGNFDLQNNQQFGYGGGQNSPRPSSVGSAWQAYEIITAMSRRNQRLQSNARGAYATLPLDDNLLAERMSINMRDKCIAYCLSCLDIICIWECCGAWLKIQKIIALIVFDPFTELFIILCILINTLFMALDSDDADDQMRNIFERGNYFFTATFAVEASMKIMALSPKFYFREGWNVFDSIIVGLSLLELGLEGVYGLSVLRSFRLLRVFKLAKSWPTLNLLISIMGKAVGDLGNLTFVLAIIVFIFAVMGMQLFGNKYVAENFPSKELPRWNFTDFMHSFMIVFRILCAEWIEPMWDCLLVGGWPCIPFFLIAVTVGNLVVLNLFLALLLASFGASNLSSPQADNVDTKKLQEAIGRFSRFGRWTRRWLARTLTQLASCLLRRGRRRGGRGRQGSKMMGGDGMPFGVSGAAGGTNLDDGGLGVYLDADGRPMKPSHIATMSRLERLQNIEKRTEELKNKIRRSPEHHYHLRQLAKSQLKASSRGGDSSSGSGGGFNFNYDRHQGRGANSEQGGLDSMTAPMGMPTIPIIVNEACDSQVVVAIHDEDEGDMNDADEQHYKQQDHYQVNETINEMDELSSLNSDVSIKPSDFLSSSNKDQGGHDNCRSLSSTDFSDQSKHYHHQQPNQATTTTTRHPTIVAGYSNIMQPIRENSKDDSCSSCSLSQKRVSVELVEDNGNDLKKDTKKKDDDDADQNENNQQQQQRRLSTSTSQTFARIQHKRADLSAEEKQQQQQAKRKDSVSFLTKSKSANYSFPAAAAADESAAADKFDSSTMEKCQPTARQLVVQPAQQCLDEQQQQLITVDENEPKPTKSSLYLKAPKRQEMEEDDEKTLQHIETYIEKCICIGIVCLKWFLFRQFVRKIVEHKYFDQCILILIVISSGTLALEDKHLNERPALKQTLDVLDTIFTIIFSLEMIFKWLAFGMRRYFGNIWSWLDFIIVLVSFVNLMASIFGSGKIQALKTMRTLRAMRGLRPLRALQRFQGMRVVVNALIQAIPSIFNVLLVCLIFWLIFSIMGVQMFGGKFWRCLDPKTQELVAYEVASNRLDCLERNLTWSNPQINFDNVLNAYLALFQVATFKGWIDIMNSATDSRMRDDQPIREANIYMYFYFVFFVIFGSFFTLNLFIGVIIDNFNEQKKKTGGSLEIFMTDDQKKYYHAMKKMRSKKPIKAMTRPKIKFQAYMFDIITSKRFDLAIMLIIGLNMFVMALEHYGQSQEFSLVLENLNLIFIAIFTLECLCKIFAMRHFYFREPWNIFDFIVVDLSLLGVVMKEYVAKYFVSPTLLRVVRVVKVGRVLRLVKGAKGIRTLLFALAMSLPALFNICLLLFLVMFIYAIFGMSFFMNVRKRSGIDETFNFETFSSSIIILFQMSTSAGWDLVLDPLMDEENDCQKPDPAQGIEGTCGNKSIAIFYLISYVIVTFLIIINMYIAVILENYSQATEDVQEGLTDDDYEMYYEIWQKFDPNGTQYLPYAKLSDFVDSLEDPLRIPKPNELTLVVLDINIYEGNQCYCVDILDALTKYFFTRKGFEIQVNEHLQKVQSTLHETPFERVTTTYLLKREHYCAKVIQNCWRRWRERTRATVDQ